jgi:hypothetical protein
LFNNYLSSFVGVFIYIEKWQNRGRKVDGYPVTIGERNGFLAWSQETET